MVLKIKARQLKHTTNRRWLTQVVDEEGLEGDVVVTGAVVALAEAVGTRRRNGACTHRLRE